MTPAVEKLIEAAKCACAIMQREISWNAEKTLRSAIAAVEAEAKEPLAGSSDEQRAKV